MGREFRRVPIDFDWPLKKVWNGYVNPHFRECPKAATNECHGGYSNAGKWLDTICRFLALIGEEAAVEPHAPRTEIPRAVHLKLCEIDDTRFRELHRYVTQNPPRLLTLTEEMVEFVAGLAGGMNPQIQGGSMLGWQIQKTMLKAAGIDPDGKWGTCKVCDGHGIDPEIRETYEAWERESPPIGDGWQLWETVSEGSPVSKVYSTESEFVEYLKGEGYSDNAARKFCKSGWVPSGLIVTGGHDAGVYQNLEMLDLRDDAEAT